MKTMAIKEKVSLGEKRASKSAASRRTKAKSTPAIPNDESSYRERHFASREANLAALRKTCEEGLRDPDLTPAQRKKYQMALHSVEYHELRLPIERRLLEPTLSEGERRELMYQYHPPASRENELSEDGQCRSNFRRMLEGGKYAKDEELLRRLCVTLLAFDNEDKLMALMALKHLSRSEPGQKNWREAVKWLLHRWCWICPYDADQAKALLELMDAQTAKPVILENPSDEDHDKVQEMLWHLLPTLHGNQRAWEMMAEEDYMRECKLRGIKSEAVAKDLGLSDSTIRQRIRRDKQRGKSRA